jgi:hypothetical protein
MQANRDTDKQHCLRLDLNHQSQIVLGTVGLIHKTVMDLHFFWIQLLFFHNDSEAAVLAANHSY